MSKLGAGECARTRVSSRRVAQRAKQCFMLAHEHCLSKRRHRVFERGIYEESAVVLGDELFGFLDDVAVADVDGRALVE